MIHAREDYNRIQDPAIEFPSMLTDGHTAIGENEPVFLLRAKDKHFIDMLRLYITCIDDDDDMTDEEYEKMRGVIERHIENSAIWQAANGTKSPDL